MTLFGSHLSIAGGMVNALKEAAELKLDCVQVFTKNQRQWKATALKDEDRAAWLEELDRVQWRPAPDKPARVVSHNSYLINLASPDKEIRAKSLALQRLEMELCESLEIPLLVAHPGAHLGAARPTKQPNDLEREPDADEAAGLQRIVQALDQLHRETAGYRTITCLETTVGSGTNLGYAFHHLARIRDAVRDPDRVAFCFDTCHVTAAGYDMTTDAAAESVLAEFDRVCGLSNLRVLHMNDSEGAVGSRKDRHAHIGHGTCGLSCFRAIVNHPALAAVPAILETPKEDDEHGRPWDQQNVERLKGLIHRPAISR